MRLTLVLLAILLFVPCRLLNGAVAFYPLPAPKKVSLSKPIDCRAIATTTMSENKGQLEVETGPGKDHLTIVRTGHTLRVTAHHDSTQYPDDEDTYTITSETVDFVSAVEGIKMLPVVHGFVMNKRLGTAVWSESDSTFALVNDNPFTNSVFMRCSN